MFIVFDGIDRAGKSTHLKIATNWLRSLNVDFMLAREPGGTAFAEKIRKLLIASKNEQLDPVIQLLLFSAARFDLTQHLAQIKVTEPNKLILCDRFIDSTYAYQGQFFDNATITAIAKLSVKIKPDFVFLFLNRYAPDKNAMDKFATEHRAQIIERFRLRAALEPGKYFIVPHGHIKKQEVIIREKLAKLLKIKIDPSVVKINVTAK